MSLSVRLVHAFRDFSLDVEFETKGGVTALFGASGSGKSTVVNAVAGLLHPDAGRIALSGDVFLDTESGIDVPTHARGLGYVFQEGRLFPHLSVRQNLLYASRFSADPATARDVAQVVALLGIGGLLDRLPTRLSGGEKQRVAIGRALLSKPRLLLLDEPLAALDTARKKEVLPYLARLRDETALPALYVSHSHEEVRALASHAVVLSDGRVSAEGPVGEVLGAGRGGPAATLPVIGQHDATAGRVRLVTPAGEFLSPVEEMPLTAARAVTVAASDVVLSSAPRAALAAPNVLEATVVALHRAGPGMVDARIAAGSAELTARLPIEEAARLKLAPGQAVRTVVGRFTIA